MANSSRSDNYARWFNRFRRARERQYATFRELVFRLNNSTLYSASCVALLAKRHGAIPENQTAVLVVLLDDISELKEFYKANDGMVQVAGLKPLQGWFGWRWKAAIWEVIVEDPPRIPYRRPTRNVPWPEELC